MSDPADITVLALGGNALLDPGVVPTVQNQFEVTARAMKPIADLVQRGERLVITHGNGPQVGFMALRSEIAAGTLHEVPLDSLVADTQGAIGYMIQRALREELRLRGLHVEVVAIVTEVEVDPHDHSFEEPTKPIGTFHTEEEARILERTRGWQLVEDAHRGYRRVVPSPAPTAIVQLDTIRRLVDDGVVVICCGGGGIPVTRDDDGHIVGVEGVVDKDRASALLAVALGARRLVLTTAVDGVYADFLGPAPRFLARATPGELRRMNADGQFPPGSMGPKVKACVRFVENGGDVAVVCRSEDLVAAVAGDAGTQVRAPNNRANQRPERTP
jgi:carbamate kinase